MLQRTIAARVQLKISTKRAFNESTWKFNGLWHDVIMREQVYSEPEQNIPTLRSSNTSRQVLFVHYRRLIEWLPSLYIQQ